MIRRNSLALAPSTVEAREVRDHPSRRIQPIIPSMRSLRWAVMGGALAWAAACGGRMIVDKQDESRSLPPESGGSTSSGGSSFTVVPPSGTGGAGGIPTKTTMPGPLPVAMGAGGVAPIPTGTTKTPPPPVTPPATPPDEGDAGVPDYALGGVTSDGHVVAAYWNGSTEQVVLIDPATAEPTTVGQLGNLHWWSFQFIYDSSKATAYAVGQDARFASYVYSFSLEDGHTMTTTLDGIDGGSADFILGGVTSSGMLVATSGSGTVYYLDPKTGVQTYVGEFDGLTSWSAQLLYDDGKRTAYALGNSGNFDTYYVFSLNLDTGKKTRAYIGSVESGLINYVLGGFTQDRRLVGAYWDGSLEDVIVIEPATGTTTIVGNFGSLMTWSNQLVYGGVRGTAVAYGRDHSGTARLYQVQVGK